MNIVVVLTVGLFVAALLCGVFVMPMSFKKKSVEAAKYLMIAGGVFALLSLVVMILALVLHGEPMLGFALAVMGCCIFYLVAVMIILAKTNVSDIRDYYRRR